MLNLSEVDRYEKIDQDSYLRLRFRSGIPDHGVCEFFLEGGECGEFLCGNDECDSGKKETEDAPIVKRGTVVTFTEAAASATYTVRAYDGMGNPIRDFSASLGTVKKGGTLQYTLDWNARKSEGKSSYTGQAGVFEIQAKDSDGKTWRQRFVINNVCASGVLSNMYLYSKGALYQWKSNSKGWWVDKKSGGYLTNAWFQSPVSGLWYYMGSDGYMLTNTTTPDGYKVNASGVWVK